MFSLGSSVIQHYLREVLECYFHSQITVRSAACQVIILTLQQGLVHPVQVQYAIINCQEHTVNFLIENKFF